MISNITGFIRGVSIVHLGINLSAREREKLELHKTCEIKTKQWDEWRSEVIERRQYGLENSDWTGFSDSK